MTAKPDYIKLVIFNKCAMKYISMLSTHKTLNYYLNVLGGRGLIGFGMRIQNIVKMHCHEDSQQQQQNDSVIHESIIKCSGSLTFCIEQVDTIKLFTPA